MIIAVTNISKRSELGNNDMDGVMEMQDLMGYNKVVGNPLDLDVLNPEDPNDFVNAAGKKVAKKTAPKKPAAKAANTGLFGGFFKNMGARRDMKVKAKSESKLIKANAKQTKADAKVGEAKAKSEQAKAAAKDDGTAAILAASMSSDAAAKKSEGMSTGLKIGIGVGIAAVVITGVIIVIKIRKKKGK